MTNSTYRSTARLLLGSAVLYVAWLIGFGATVHAQTPPTHSNKEAQTIKAADIVRDPSDLPPPIGERAPAVVKVTLTSKELVGVLDPATGTTYRYWTFDGKVPAPFIRVLQGDTVEVTLVNLKDSTMVHSVDFHAAIGPGGGAALTQVPPGQSKTFSFQATTPGLFVYHCGSPMIAQHIANGMYGMVLVEPAGGLPKVDHEYYLMQGEIYATAPKGKAGLQQFSPENLMAENAQYYVFNGAVDSLTKEYPLHAKEGETVRIFFGNAGPNSTASEHMVGEIFTHDYQLGSLSSPPLSGIQTATVPPGGAAILEIKASMPGQFALMDHAISRMEQVYRVEAQPLLFSENAGRLVHVMGHVGSVLPVEDPRVPSYVVDSVDAIMPNCSPKTTLADIRKALEPPEGPVGGVVTMGSMTFSPATITINTGEQVVWKNTSTYYHNVVDDPGRALSRVDVSMQSGAIAFGSALLQPGATFYHTFDKPGIYRYVCTVHETGGMKATVIVKPGPLLASSHK